MIFSVYCVVVQRLAFSYRHGDTIVHIKLSLSLIYNILTFGALYFE